MTILDNAEQMLGNANTQQHCITEIVLRHPEHEKVVLRAAMAYDRQLKNVFLTAMIGIGVFLLQV